MWLGTNGGQMEKVWLIGIIIWAWMSEHAAEVPYD